MHFQLLALDLDGTLLQPDGSIHPTDLAAVHDARDAGCLVVPCTGRGHVEARAALDQLGYPTPGIFNTGALVVDHPSRDTLAHHGLAVDLTAELLDHLADAPEALLLYQDANRTGRDYLVTGRGTLDDNSGWWFEHVGAAVHQTQTPTADDLRHTVRVGLVGTLPRVLALVEQVADAFADRVEVHGFPAVQSPNPAETVAILEVFAAGVHKWRGIAWLADHHGIEHRRVAFLGDEVNDLPALRHAGLGVAMGNAVPAARDAADAHTRPNTEQGVAHAITQMLNGKWHPTPI